jgi:hypothetical protein
VSSSRHPEVGIRFAFPQVFEALRAARSPRAHSGDGRRDAFRPNLGPEGKRLRVKSSRTAVLGCILSELKEPTVEIHG